MAQFETYQSNAAEVPLMRKWILRALVISLLIHAGLIFFFQTKKLENFGYTGDERLAPPVRVLSRVEIPDIPDDDAKLVIPEKKQDVATILIPTDKPEVDIVQITPQAPTEVTKPIVNEKPQADVGGFDALAKIEANSLGALEKQLSSMAGGIMEKNTRAKGQAVIKVPTGPKNGDGGVGNMAGIPGRQSLDEALARTGPLPEGDKPIGVPGGALYEWGRADLRPEAIDELRKLGELIKRNPKSTFSIEGHTDSTGTQEYNQTLSEQRAESVKLWLVQFMGIAPERIQTKGFGNTKLIVPPRPYDTTSTAAFDAEMSRQQPNRRVEIVIKTNR